MGYYKSKIDFLVCHPLRNVYLFFFAQLLSGFVVTTTLVVRLDAAYFAEYSFALMSAGCLSSVVSSSFDALINKRISEGFLGFYFSVIGLKVALYFLFCLVYLVFVGFSEGFFYLVVVLSFLLVMVEHQDVFLRCRRDYSSYGWRLLLVLIGFPLKLILGLSACVSGLLVVSVIEVTICFFINLRSISWQSEDEYEISLCDLKDIAKTSLASVLVFLFLRLDQFFVYYGIGREVFSSYALATRFNELANGVVGIFCRYYIPSLYSGDLRPRSILLKLWGVHSIFSVVIFFVAVLYVIFLGIDYWLALSILPLLLFSGIFLLFGQVRGCFFVQESSFTPDIINAAVGILVFLLLSNFQIFANESINITIILVISFCVSGFFMTFAYSRGRIFICELLRG